MNRISAMLLGLLASAQLTEEAIAQIASLEIRVHKDGALLDPDPGTLIDVSGDSPIVGPTNHDDDMDGNIDRVSYIYNVVSSVTLDLLSGPGEMVDRWERTVGVSTFTTEDSSFISFGIGSDTEVDLYLVDSITASPESEPVSCRIAPFANTRTGTVTTWGQASHTLARSVIDPDAWSYPLNLYSGEFCESIVDFHAVGRGLDFVWARRYRSQEVRSSGLGTNWDHSYNLFVEDFGGPVGSGQAIVRMGNGRAELFEENHFLGGKIYYYAPGWEAVLTQDLNDFNLFQLRFGNGTVWTFDNNEGPEDGKVSTIEDRYGNTLEFDYDGSGKLVTVTDTLDREYTLNYGGDDTIDSISEVHGKNRTIAYTYYGASDPDGNPGDLKSVTYPAITGTVTGNNFPSGRSLTYTYDKDADPALNGNLLTIEDGRGNTVLTNTYDSNDRVITQVWGSDGDSDAIVGFDYPESPTGLVTGEVSKCITNDGEGNVSELYFDEDNRLVRLKQFTGRANPITRSTETTNRPDNKLRPGDPDFFETRYDWTDHDLLREVTYPLGNRTVFFYHNDDNPRRIAELTRIRRYDADSQVNLRVDLDYKDDWVGDADKFTGCRCDESFLVEREEFIDGGPLEEEIVYDYDESGNLVGVSYGALSGYPNTMHESFTHNAFGQVDTHTLPDNGSGYARVDDFEYYTSGDGHREGYLHYIEVDTNTLALRTSFDYDLVGNLSGITPPNGFNGTALDSDQETTFLYNSNDELIRRQSREPSTSVTNRNTVDVLYDANGNVTSRRVWNRDESGALQTNQLFSTEISYDSLNRPVDITQEIDPSTSAVTEFQYTRNGLTNAVRSPLAEAEIAPNTTTNRLYDERDMLFKQVRGLESAAQLTTQYDYDLNGNLVAVIEGLEEGVLNRRTTSLEYDQFDRLEEITDPIGNTKKFVYDGADRVTGVAIRGVASVLLHDVAYTYDLSGRTTNIAHRYRDHTGALISGNVNGISTGDGEADTNILYTNAFQVRQVVFEGNTTERVYDTANRLLTETDPLGNEHTYSYDGNSNVTRIDEIANNDLGGSQAFQTRLFYDQLDRLVLSRQRYSTSSGGLFNDESFAYDSRDNLVARTDARGFESTFSYDGLSRLVQSSFDLDPGTVNTTVTYDLNSRVTSRSDPNGNATTYVYDALDRVTGIVYADGSSVTLGLNRFGEPVTRTDPTGTTFAHTFDKLGRLLSRTATAAEGYVTTGVETYGYDGLSRIVSAADGDTAVTVAYDSFGNPLAESLQISGGVARTVTHVNNDNGHRRKSVFPGGRTIERTYDNLERLKTILDATGTPTTLASYDYVGGRVARRTYNANGTDVDYTYGGVGTANPAGDYSVKRVIATDHMDGATPIDTRTYGWDPDQNKLQRADTRAGGPQLTYDFEYDALSRLREVDDGATPVTYTYDAAGNRANTGYSLEGVDAALNNYTTTPFDSGRGYDALSNLTTLDARAEQYTFDVHNRLISYVTSGSRTEDTINVGGNYTTISGTWSVDDGILSETTATTGRLLRALDTDIIEFGFSYRSPHDPEDTSDFDPERYALVILRLVEPDSPAEWRYVALVIEPTGLYLREWEDDTLLGELAAAEVDSKPDTWYDVVVGYGGADDRDLTIHWAKRGDPLKALFAQATYTVTLAEDDDQRLGFGVGQLGDYEFTDILFRDETDTAAGVAVTYQYDALGRRVAKTLDPGGTPDTTHYHYDGARVIEERTGAGAVTATYVHGRYIDEVLTMARGGEDYYYHQDDLYTIMAITDGNGDVVERYDYGPFGQQFIYEPNGAPRATTAIGNPYGFTGRRHDPETALTYYRTRYLDPAAGRFITRDTIGLYGDPNNLGNGQAYTGNNPWTRVDPYGLEGGFLDWFLGWIGLGDGQAAINNRPATSTKQYTPPANAKPIRGNPDWMINLAEHGDPNDRSRELDVIGSTLDRQTRELAAHTAEHAATTGAEEMAAQAGGWTIFRGISRIFGRSRSSIVAGVDEAGGMAARGRAGEQLEFDFVRASANRGAQNRATVGWASSFDYRRAFFSEYPDLEGYVVVHHAIERQILLRYPGRFSEAELHSLENLRGVPHAINPDLHLSAIRKVWNRFYRENPNATRQQILDEATRIDRDYGRFFKPPR